MKVRITFLLLCIASFTARAQVSCPPGMMPYGTAQDISVCGPIPGQQQSSPPNAPPMKWVSQWGAVALDTKATGNIGASHNQPNRAKAEEIALKNCGTNSCELISSYANGCVALAESDTKFGIASRPSIDEAKIAAASQCGDQRGCKIVYSNCSQASRVQ